MELSNVKNQIDKYFDNISAKDLYEILSKYWSELYNESKSMPGDFAELLNEHFSELL